VRSSYSAQAARRVAFQGAPGAFSFEAARHYLPDCEPIPHASFDEMFEAVQSGGCELAFAPVENSIAGRVPEVAELLPRTGLKVLSEHDWPIRIQLMATPGATLRDLRLVASHPMALKQCGAFLSAHGLETEAAFDTAGAAAQLAARPDPVRGVLAARAAAQRHGLVILAEDVQDRGENVTRFAKLARA
jgi:prephenate dehydratase